MAPRSTQPTTTSQTAWNAAAKKGYDPNSPEYQAMLLENAQLGKTLLGGNRSADPEKVLTGLAKPGGGVWGTPTQVTGSGPRPPQISAAPTAPAAPAFDMQGFLNSMNQSQAAIARANAEAAARQQQSFMEWQNTMTAQQAERDAAARAQVDAYNAQVAAQQKQQYERQLLLNADQIKAINEQKATVEQTLRDAAARFEAGRGETQARTQADISQVVRDYAASRGQGLASLAARNRGIDPSAAGRFLAEQAAGRAGALARTQTSGYDTLRQLKEQLDAQQFSGSSRIAELNRLATQLGTNLTNLFPGVNF